MSSINGVVIRRVVEDLDESIAFYEALTGEQARRFRFGGVGLAAVGHFLLLDGSGNDGRLADVVATVTVDDLTGTHRLLAELGADIVAPPVTTPNGRRLVARHPDGGVFEYVGR